MNFGAELYPDRRTARELLREKWAEIAAGVVIVLAVWALVFAALDALDAWLMAAP